MARGKHKTKLTRSERIEKACELFERGYNDTDVAKILKVARNTAKNYRAIYEERLAEKARDNPQLLQDVLGNTVRMVEELDHVRRAAWKEYEKADKKQKIECPECGEEVAVIFPDPDLRNKLLNTAMKAQTERAKLLGTIGVKAEFLAMVAGVKHVQEQLIKFMSTTLCAEDRDKLVAFLSSPEMAPYMGSGGVMTVESWEEGDEVHEHAQLSA